jgi:hypothetical protein
MTGSAVANEKGFINPTYFYKGFEIQCNINSSEFQTEMTKRGQDLTNKSSLPIFKET